MSGHFQNRMQQCTELVNAHLDSLLTTALLPGEKQRLPRLIEAMRHGVLNGGKRLRPFLVLESASLFGTPESAAMNTACALECLHSYSLVHDDLPAMDNDDLRRGKPTVHKAFDEATAILAGDALLTMAFELVTRDDEVLSSAVRLKLANLLARAAGQGGMIGGQILDIEAETKSPDENEIRTLQAMKTGALIRYACEAGAVIGHASQSERESLVRYGETIGLAFQLADDLLDVTSDSETMGKAVGKDADAGKGTLVGIYGVDKTRTMLNELVQQAHDCLSDFQDAGILRDTANFIVERQS